MGFLLACPVGTCAACSMLGKIGGDAADVAIAGTQRRAQEDAERTRLTNAARDQAVRAEAGARLQRARASLNTAREREQAKAYRDAEAAVQDARAQIAPLLSLVPPVDEATALNAEITTAEGRVVAFVHALETLDDARRSAPAGQVFADVVAEEEFYLAMVARLDAISGPASAELADDIRDVRRPLQQASQRVHGRAETLRRQREREAERDAIRRRALSVLCGDTPPIVGTNTAAGYYRTIARDPDSVAVESCDTPRLGVDRCWLVLCDVRERNASGGMTRNAVEFEVGRGSRLKRIRRL